MNIPAELKYTKDHEWIRLEDNIATIGITDHAQSELGEIVYVECDALDDEVDAEEAFGTVEAVKTTSDLYMPVTGKIIEFNDALEDNPELVNEDPYGKGWIIKVEVNDPEMVALLLDASAYETEIS